MIRTVADIALHLRSHPGEAMRYKTGYRTFTLTYEELHEKVLKTASLLKQLKLKKGDKLIVWGYNCPQWGIVFLAASLQGIIVVPVDYMATRDFVTKLKHIVKAKLICHSEFKLPEKLDIPSLILEHLDQRIELQSAWNGTTGVRPEDILEIVFTSGTTGNPKGVILTHENLVSNMRSVSERITLPDHQKFLSLLPLSHLLEQNASFLWPLSHGYSITYIRTLRPSLIFSALADTKPTVIILVPRLLKLFSDEIQREAAAQKKTGMLTALRNAHLPGPLRKAAFGTIHRKFGGRLRYIVSGGAALPEKLQAFWEELGFIVIQGYGLTECSPVVTAGFLDGQPHGTVGKPLAGVSIKLGKDGEILVKGDNITPGYYQDKAKTRELFERGWMRTGDIGEITNSWLSIKGRAKDVIVTSNGINVYPEDIETELLKNASVKDVCVLGIHTEQGEEVHAEIILKSAADTRQIIAETNGRLNEAQQINSFAIWEDDDFPRTTTLKVKKRLVIERINSRGQAGAAPASKLPKLYLILASVCGVEPHAIKRGSRLALDLKLTSISRVELISVLEQEFNLDINEDDITPTTTVGKLENLIKKREKLPQSVWFARWALDWPAHAARAIFQDVISPNVFGIWVKRRVTGAENLDGFCGPAIIIANHVGYFDGPTVLSSLPRHIRSRVAIAASREFFLQGKTPFKRWMYRRLLFFIGSVLFNTYTFATKNAGYKKCLEYTGELVDKKWNILIFPEGRHNPDKSLSAFKSGIAFLIQEMQLPVIAVRTRGIEKIMHGNTFKIRGKGIVSVSISKPTRLDYTKSLPELSNELQRLLDTTGP